jgi:hypothetical protein
VRRAAPWIIGAFFGLAAGGALVWQLTRPDEPRRPDTPAVVTRIREVVRLETLEVSAYKKINFEPEPESSTSFWGDVVAWVKHSVRPLRGKAIVFADLRFSFDLSRLDARVVGDAVEVLLPPPGVVVELKPGETEVIGSNLDSAQTAELFERAKLAFEREARADPTLSARARASAERSVRGLLLSLGFREVRFVKTIPVATPL